MAYDARVVGLHAPDQGAQSPRRSAARRYPGLIDATVGRLIFNDPIPQDLGYVDRSDSDKQFDLEISFLVKQEAARTTSSTAASVCMAPPVPPRCWTDIKAQGFKYSTRSGHDRCRRGCGYPRRRRQTSLPRPTRRSTGYPPSV